MLFFKFRNYKRPLKTGACWVLSLKWTISINSCQEREILQKRQEKESKSQRILRRALEHCLWDMTGTHSNHGCTRSNWSKLLSWMHPELTGSHFLTEEQAICQWRLQRKVAIFRCGCGHCYVPFPHAGSTNWWLQEEGCRFSLWMWSLVGSLSSCLWH